MTLLTIILLVIVVEAVTEILTSSELTEPFRQAWKRQAYPIDGPPPDDFYQHARIWSDKLISCGYCTSVWVAAFFAIWAPTWFEPILINWICMTFVLHRLANWIHVVFELVKKGRVKTYDLELKLEDNRNGDFGESIPEKSAETGP